MIMRHGSQDTRKMRGTLLAIDLLLGRIYIYAMGEKQIKQKFNFHLMLRPQPANGI